MPCTPPSPGRRRAIAFLIGVVPAAAWTALAARTPLEASRFHCSASTRRRDAAARCHGVPPWLGALGAVGVTGGIMGAFRYLDRTAERDGG